MYLPSGSYIMPDERIVRDMHPDDQVRDSAYVAEQEDNEMESIMESMEEPAEPGKKKKETMFLPVKSKKQQI